jgi:cysteine desulfurase
MKFPIYLDNHATTPLDPRVLAEMMPYLTNDYGNAASMDHIYGAKASDAVEKSRKQIARTINARPEEIVFTSGATESDNLALLGVAHQYADRGTHIITSVTEHKAVLDTSKHLEEMGRKVTYLPVDQFGLVDIDKLDASVSNKTILISIMAANNEIGTIAPIPEIGKIAHERGVIFHTDAAQAVGHIPIDVEEMNIDLMSFSAHKVNGPKGIGAIYVRRRNPKVKLSPIIFGGGHERGMRSGTLNVPGIVGFGKALEIARNEMDKETTRFTQWTKQMFEAFKDRLSGNMQLNGHPTRRLPHNLNLFFEGIESKALIPSVRAELAISAGSACTSDLVEPSHVLMSLGFGESRAHSSIRFGLGRYNTEEEIQYVMEKIPAAINQLQRVTLR